MTQEPAKPLTADEIADLKAKAKAATEILARGGKYQHDIGAETILRLIDMIEQRDEQIEKLGATATMFTLVNRLGMDIETATDEVYREILRQYGEEA